MTYNEWTERIEDKLKRIGNSKNLSAKDIADVTYPILVDLSIEYVPLSLIENINAEITKEFIGNSYVHFYGDAEEPTAVACLEIIDKYISGKGRMERH